jgi:hypothetical protein
MVLARVYVLLALAIIIVVLHSMCAHRRQIAEGYTGAEGKQLADKKLSQRNANDLRDLQQQVKGMEDIRQQILNLNMDVKGHKMHMDRITHQVTLIGPGKHLSGVKVPKSQQQSMTDKYNR